MTIKAIYIYTDERGRPVMRKIRRSSPTKDKDFATEAAQYKNDRLYWKGGRGCFERYQPEWHDRVIYNLPMVLDALTYGQPIAIPEGERDCDGLSTIAKVCTTTGYQGAAQFTHEQAEWFVARKSKSPIHIIRDNDEPGLFAASLRYSRLIDVGVRPRRIHLWRPPSPYKDVCEALAAVGRRGSAVVPEDPDAVRDAASRVDAKSVGRYANGNSPTGGVNPHTGFAWGDQFELTSEEKGKARTPDVVKGHRPPRQ